MLRSANVHTYKHVIVHNTVLHYNISLIYFLSAWRGMNYYIFIKRFKINLFVIHYSSTTSIIIKIQCIYYDFY